jgi:uncharacterized damage-inducible protein DinB
MAQSNASNTTLLDEALEAWQYTRQGVIDELKLLTGAGLSFSPAAGARTTADLVRHIVESGLMASGELSRADGDFLRQPYPEHVREYAAHVAAIDGHGALLDLLGTSLEQGVAAIRQAGELHMLQTIRRFDGQRGTRLAWLNHAVDHESYHRGQLAMYVRISGRTPALTRLIQGEG